MQLSARPYAQRNRAMTAVVDEASQAVGVVAVNVQRSRRALVIHSAVPLARRQCEGAAHRVSMTPYDWMPQWLRDLWEVPGVTDVLINGPGQVWLDRGLGLESARDVAPLAVLPTQASDVRGLAVRLASLSGKRLDDASPTVDARLPDGTRFHAVLPPIADGCATMSLRRVRSAALDWDDLRRLGMVHPEVDTMLRGLVSAGASLVISGATGTGKTTLLSTLMGEVDPSERLVLIEEAGEARPAHPHVVRLVERRPNVDGAGAVGLAQLVREALRMRPDRLVVGECRGAEVREMLLALNTGHGGFTTLHANAAADVPARLIALGALAGLSESAVALHAAAAFDAVVHVERQKGVRRVATIASLEAVEGRLCATPALHIGLDGSLARGPAWAALVALVENRAARIGTAVGTFGPDAAGLDAAGPDASGLEVAA